MQLNWLAFSVPLFLLIMAIEFLIARKKGLPYFNLHHSIANISVGIAERMSDLFVTGLFLFVYQYLHRHFGVFYIRPSVILWVVLFIVSDFVWYWYHRLAHEINIFWAAHVVHHQSEDFNYTVSARITVFQAFIRAGFWCVLPILGFPPSMIISVLLVHGIYPFFIHTRLIGNLGLLEYVLVTPSHHRVHHASNEKYLDKNYGDVFIIWDKLFGTFQKEETGEAVEYGLTKPLNSYSFLWQHFHFFIEMWFAYKRASGLKQKWNVLFGSPAEFDPRARADGEKAFNIYKRHAVLAQRLNRYVAWQLVIALIMLFLSLLFTHHIPEFQQLLFAGVLLLTLINCGAIMEQKKWVFYIEYGRLFLVAIAVVVEFPGTYTVALIVMGATLLLYYFNRVNEKYLNLVYPDQ